MGHCEGSSDTLSEKWSHAVPAHILQAGWGINRRNWRSVCHCKSAVSLRSQKHSGKSHMTGVLQWMGTRHCKGQAGTARRGRCPECERAAGIHGVLPEMGGPLAGSLWVKIRQQTSVGSIVAGVCSRPADQGEADKVSLASWKKPRIWRPWSSRATWTTQIICCRNNTAGHRQSLRCLELIV